MATGLARKLWSIEEYERMIELGILGKDDHVELIRGEIVEKAPISTHHAACVMRLGEIFHGLSQRTVIISIKNPIQFLTNSVPEPDVALLKRRNDHYANQRPTANDVLLLVDVSDSTTATDRRDKIPLYAEAGIPEVWLVNVDEGVIEVFANPVGGAYMETRRASSGEELALPGELQGKISVGEGLGY